MCVLEGPDLVEAALASGCEFEAIYVDDTSVTSPSIAALLSNAERAGVRVFGLSPDVLSQVADAKTPQPVAAVVRLPLSDLAGVSATSFV